MPKLKIDYSRRSRPKLTAEGSWIFEVLEKDTFKSYTLTLSGAYTTVLETLPACLKERGTNLDTVQITLVPFEAPVTISHRQRTRERRWRRK